MAEISRSTHLPGVTPEQVWAWHMHRGTFERLAPPWRDTRVERFPEDLVPGATAELAVRAAGTTWRWTSTLTRVEPPVAFEDETRGAPLRAWHHVHRFDPEQGGTRLSDSVRFELAGPAALAAPSFGGEVARLLAHRHRLTRDDLARHGAHAHRPRLTVGITGASGLVGTALTAFLRGGGHRVVPFVRRAPREGEIGWDVEAGRLDPRDLEGLDAVVHLAGEPLAGPRWTEARKARILSSRVDGTRLLAEALARCARPPSVLVSASAVGFWGHTPEPIDDTAGPGRGFLAEVAVAWEEAAAPARAAGLRVVHPRLGLVVSGRDGVLPTLARPVAWGAGGPVGTGRQGMAWVALEDVVGALHEALLDPRYEGPFALVAPETATQASFTRTLARVLCRPAVARAPAAAVRLLLGEQADALILEGQLVQPSRLHALGFTWRRPHLEDAIRWELGRFDPEEVST